MCHRADPDWGIYEFVILPFTKDLQWFCFNLAIFAAHIDSWKDVVDDVQRRNAGIARARQRLHRDHVNRLELELLMQRRKREDEPDCGTVRIRDDESLAVDPFLLRFKSIQVVRIDLGNQ